MKYLIGVVALLLLVSACSTYTSSEPVTDDERAYVEKAITAMFLGPEEAKEYLTQEYYDELTESGYWDEIKKYELVNLNTIYINKEGSTLTAKVYATYKNKETGEQKEDGRAVYFEGNNGKFLISGV